MLDATRLTAEIPQTHLSLCKTLWAATVRMLDVASPMPGGQASDGADGRASGYHNSSQATRRVTEIRWKFEREKCAIDRSECGRQ